MRGSFPFLLLLSPQDRRWSAYSSVGAYHEHGETFWSKFLNQSGWLRYPSHSTEKENSPHINTTAKDLLSSWIKYEMETFPRKRGVSQEDSRGNS